MTLQNLAAPTLRLLRSLNKKIPRSIYQSKEIPKLTLTIDSKLSESAWALIQDTDLKWELSPYLSFDESDFWNLMLLAEPASVQRNVVGDFLSTQYFGKDTTLFDKRAREFHWKFESRGRESIWLPITPGEFFTFPKKHLKKHEVISFDPSWLESFEKVQVDWWEMMSSAQFGDLKHAEELYFPRNYLPTDISYLRTFQNLRVLQMNPGALLIDPNGTSPSLINLNETSASFADKSSYTAFERFKAIMQINRGDGNPSSIRIPRSTPNASQVLGLENCRKLEHLILLSPPSEATLNCLKKIPNLKKVTLVIDKDLTDTELNKHHMNLTLKTIAKSLPDVILLWKTNDNRKLVPFGFRKQLKNARREFAEAKKKRLAESKK